MSVALFTDERQFHIKTLPGEVGEYVILTGDPGRVPKIAEYLDDAKFISQNREYTVYTGALEGVKVSVCSTGIGGPSAAIAIEELIRCGGKNFIRIGTSGGMSLDVVGGDIIIPSAAIRGDGTSREYLTEDYPAVADFTLTQSLYNAAQRICSGKEGDRVHVGVIQSKDSFYGETHPETMPVSTMLKERWDAYIRAGCLTSEMECATLFSVGLARRVRVGAVIGAIWNVERSAAGLSNPVTTDVTRGIEVAIAAIKDEIKSRG
ncbi:MAG: nucleoside phosphorylase [Clostridia bacterium]|nr:nucleoside phosphorylase [Clostridia bacterium]